jgi:hypothetical protein
MRMILLSLGLLIAGFAGGYAVQSPAVSFVLHHLGGLGSVGVLAGVVGTVAGKKGYRYGSAFWTALSTAILLGLIAAYLVPPSAGESRPAACGGSVSLAVAIIFIAAWAFVKRKETVVVPRLT